MVNLPPSIPSPVAEADLWTGARDILHFVGVCGAGKTTLANKLTARCTSHGGKAIEDPPGERTGAFGTLNLAYLRDPSGNKICAMYRVG